jgi:hypothetical protein
MTETPIGRARATSDSGTLTEDEARMAAVDADNSADASDDASADASSHDAHCHDI